MKISDTLAQGSAILRRAKDDPLFMQYFIQASAAYETEYMTYLANDIKTLAREEVVARFRQIGH